MMKLEKYLVTVEIPDQKVCNFIFLLLIKKELKKNLLIKNKIIYIILIILIILQKRHLPLIF